MAKLSFGFKTAPQDTTHEAMLPIWQEADGIEAYEHAWLFDHFAPISGNVDGPCLEGWTLLAAYAALTKRLRVGLMVTGNTYRHPAVMAKIASTVDVISGGRLDFGIGAGWNVYEHESMGIPLYQPGERIRRLGEACALTKLLWTQHTTDFDGRYYQLKDARCEPKPVQKPYPPFVIGGSGEKLTLRVVAEHADVWNFAGGPAETLTAKHKILQEHCGAVGRDPNEIVVSVQVPVNYADPQATIDAAQRYVDVGATHLILNFRPPYPDHVAARVAEAVIPKVRG